MIKNPLFVMVNFPDITGAPDSFSMAFDSDEEFYYFLEKKPSLAWDFDLEYSRWFYLGFELFNGQDTGVETMIIKIIDNFKHNQGFTYKKLCDDVWGELPF